MSKKRNKSDGWDSRTGPSGQRYWNGPMWPTEIPKGRVLAHNHIRHHVSMPNGENGFRCWTWPEGKQPEHFVPCPCGWAWGQPHLAWRENVEASGKCMSDAEFEKLNGYTIDEAIDMALDEEEDAAA